MDHFWTEHLGNKFSQGVELVRKLVAADFVSAKINRRLQSTLKSGSTRDLINHFKWTLKFHELSF